MNLSIFVKDIINTTLSVKEIRCYRWSCFVVYIQSSYYRSDRS